jgi:hypothetical protein
MILNDELKINTIYIISKGRPQCTTARTLTKINYPGEWFIVCGNNDETIPQYIENWGEDRVLIFDWYEEIKTTNTLDNFGFEIKGSGACPVRNATRRISAERGENRHWQFDDDYNSFQRFDVRENKNKTIKDGKVLFSAMYRIAELGYKADMQNIGFSVATLEAHPDNRKKFAKRIFNAHNMINDPDKFVKWVGRMNDDTINAINVWKSGGYEMQLRYVQMAMKETQAEKGGLTEMYKADGTVRKTAYLMLVAPNASKLTLRFGRYHHKVDWTKIVPKLIREEHKIKG